MRWKRALLQHCQREIWCRFRFVYGRMLVIIGELRDRTLHVGGELREVQQMIFLVIRRAPHPVQQGFGKRAMPPG